MLYNNDGTNGPILPLDYHFDFDDTKISLAYKHTIKKAFHDTPNQYRARRGSR